MQIKSVFISSLFDREPWMASYTVGDLYTYWILMKMCDSGCNLSNEINRRCGTDKN